MADRFTTNAYCLEITEDAIVLLTSSGLRLEAKILDNHGFLDLLATWSARDVYEAVQQFDFHGVYQIHESGFVTGGEALEPGEFPDWSGPVLVFHESQSLAIEYIKWLLAHDDDEEYEVFWLREWPGDLEEELHANALDAEADELEKEALEDSQILFGYRELEWEGLAVHPRDVVDQRLEDAVLDGRAGYRAQREYDRQYHEREVLRGGEARLDELWQEAEKLRKRATELRQGRSNT